MLERLRDLDLHLLDLERLRHVVEGADLHRLDGRLDRAERGHQDDRRRRVQRPRGAQHVEAVGAAHVDVADDDVEAALVQPLERGVAVGGLVDVVARVGERAREPAAQRVVIVGDENAAHGRTPLTRLRRRRLSSRRAVDGQRHPEPRASLRSHAQVDAAVVGVDDLADDRQAQARAARLRREERAEDAVPHLLGHARPVVGHLDLDDRAAADWRVGIERIRRRRLVAGA